MGKIAGIKQSAESKIESGVQSARPAHVLKWAEAVGISVEDFLTTDPPSVIHHIQSQEPVPVGCDHPTFSQAMEISYLREQLDAANEKFMLLKQRSEDRITELKTYIKTLEER
jgi:transcriptional regulator with XRE-family HTH domain